MQLPEFTQQTLTPWSATLRKHQFLSLQSSNLNPIPMRLLQFLTLATALISMQAFSQTHLQPLQPGGTVPQFFHCPSQQGVTQQIEARERSGNPMNEKEKKFTREMSYYAQQRTMTDRKSVV